MKDLADYGAFKRGKPYEITWEGGRGDNVLLFELYRDERKIHVFDERPNVGNSTFIIPADVKPGNNYRFKISDKRNKDEVVFTDSFRIKRKTPLAAKAGIGLIAAGLVGVLISTTGEPDEIPFPGLPE